MRAAIGAATNGESVSMRDAHLGRDHAEAIAAFAETRKPRFNV